MPEHNVGISIEGGVYAVSGGPDPNNLVKADPPVALAVGDDFWVRLKGDPTGTAEDDYHPLTVTKIVASGTDAAGPIKIYWDRTATDQDIRPDDIAAVHPAQNQACPGVTATIQWFCESIQVKVAATDTILLDDDGSEEFEPVDVDTNLLAALQAAFPWRTITVNTVDNGTDPELNTTTITGLPKDALVFLTPSCLASNPTVAYS